MIILSPPSFPPSMFLVEPIGHRMRCGGAADVVLPALSTDTQIPTSIVGNLLARTLRRGFIDMTAHYILQQCRTLPLSCRTNFIQSPGDDWGWLCRYCFFLQPTRNKQSVISTTETPVTGRGPLRLIPLDRPHPTGSGGLMSAPTQRLRTSHYTTSCLYLPTCTYLFPKEKCKCA